jgi:hypothetical protein
VFGKDEFHRPARERLAGYQALRVLAHALFDGASGDAGVIATVGAQEDIDRRPHQLIAPIGSNSIGRRLSKTTRPYGAFWHRPSRPLCGASERGRWGGAGSSNTERPARARELLRNPASFRFVRRARPRLEPRPD